MFKQVNKSTQQNIISLIVIAYAERYHFSEGALRNGIIPITERHGE